jgi:hypothetical protein
MNKLKKTRFFSLGRKWIFTLALFVLVFAAASVVKIHAASNITGWLWGGSEDKSMTGIFNENCSGITDPNAICGDGNETGLGWISMNRSDCDPDADGFTEGGIVNNPAYPSCPDGKEITKDINYGVQMPPVGDGSVAGSAWSSNVGWIQFDPSGGYPTDNCKPSPCPTTGVKKVGNNLVGWARIKSIEEAAALPISNSGGWLGWIKMGGVAQNGDVYGVEISKMDGTGTQPTFAWSDELGGIDFSRAKFIKMSSIDATSATLNKSNPCRPITATLADNSGGEVVTFANNTAKKDVKFAASCSPVSGISDSTSCSVASVGGSCNVNVTTNNFSTNYSEDLDVSCPTCTSTTTTIPVEEAKDCAISCPESVEVASGGDTKDIAPSCSGPDCASLSVTSCAGSRGYITIGGPSGNKCTASALSGATFKDRTTATISSNCGSPCTTNVFVKRLGWIETNP